MSIGKAVYSTTNARTIIWHQFCFLLFFKLLKVLLDTELGVSQVQTFSFASTTYVLLFVPVSKYLGSISL